MATRELMWYETGVVNMKYTTSRGSGDDIDISNYKNDILNLISHHYEKPSFDESITKGVIGDTITIEDYNGILSNYEIINNDHAWIEGNKLYFKIIEEGDNDIYLRKKTVVQF